MTDPRSDEAAAPEVPVTEVVPAEVAPDAEPLGPGRVEPGRTDLRRVTARGTLINSGFQVGLSGLGALQRVAVAAFLTRAEFGLWGIVAAILVNLSWLRQLGIGDKYLQQNEPDQERAFQKAFTLDLFASLAFFAFVALVLPLWAIVYGRWDIVLPGVLASLAMPISSFETPAWVPYRRLQYARVRYLTAIDPIVVFAVTVGLAAAGAGYWCFVVAVVAGSIAGGVVCTATSPYPLRIRYDRGTLREYVSFSWPLVGSGLSRLLVVQGTLIVANHELGISAVGSIALATSIAVFADRVDGIVSGTLYPAVCAVVKRKELLSEVFVKSNRIALMWALPFGVGLSLFADDLMHFVLGERWRPALGLLVAFGLTCALGQVAFNWAIFLRAVNDTRPIFISSLVNIAVFAAVSIPAMLALGVTGYAIGFATATGVQIVIRGYYMRRLFGDFSALRQLVRATVPTVPPAAVILALHALAPGGRTLPRALAEVAVYSLGVALCTWLFERSLVRELLGYLRGRRVPRPVAA
ncbi:MAG TPA: oligosaccharide flippase family protein [Thermoleophilaceae bacterium]|jgi:PST family polysaccharide transporter